MKINKTIIAAAFALTCAALPSFAQAQTMPRDPDAIDYRMLYNNDYSYADIKAAKARSFSDTDIAIMLRIARASGIELRRVKDKVSAGKTFAALEEEANLPLLRAKDVQREKDELAAFESAYGVTGRNGARRQNVQRDILRGSMQNKM